jgi:hypothetical protein
MMATQELVVPRSIPRIFGIGEREKVRESASERVSDA